MAIQLGRPLHLDDSPAATFDWLQQAHYATEHTTDVEIVVDISTVETISSCELNELIRLHLSVKQKGRRLVLENAQLHLSQVFTETRLDRLIVLRNHQPTWRSGS